MVANYTSETSSNTRSRRNGGPGQGIEFTTSNNGTIYPSNGKSGGSRIKSVNGGSGVGKAPMYPLSSIETRVNAHGIHSTSEERIIGEDHSENGDSKDPFNEDSKPGGISKTVEFEFHETSVAGA